MWLFKWFKWTKRLPEDSDSTCKVSVDGTDFRIYELKPFEAKWFSHKFKGPGLRCEVALCISTWYIVSTHGPFPCGSWSDLKLFCLPMKQFVFLEEMVLGEDVYKDDACLLVSNGDGDMRKILAANKARQETINRSFTQFFVRGHRFR